MRNYKMTIGYDGTRYQGWQKNKNASGTIQDKLDETLSRMLEEPIKVIASGRTDKGAHALGQVINFHTSQTFDTDDLKHKLMSVLPEDIVIYSCETADESFHARFHAKSKRYRYTLWRQSMEPALFNRKYVTCIESLPDIEKMRLGASYFIGDHDFKGFSSDKTKKSTLRRVERVTISEEGAAIHIDVVGSGFLYNMVRIMVGSLYEIGLGDRKPDTILMALASGDRQEAGATMPPEGLCLMEVTY